MKQFQERIKELRKAKDLTQEQMAEYMGVSPQAVSRWECGATCPDIFSLAQLAELFHITVDKLLGVDEKEKEHEIREIIQNAEKRIDQNITAEPISELRAALHKYPNNDKLLCSLMYALYVASEEEAFCREHDAEIVSIAYRIQEYSTDDDCRNEARCWLFRHYCDTNRKAQALQIADGMAKMETCYERNIYWALEGSERVEYLKERVSNDLHQLAWDLSAYSKYTDISDEARQNIAILTEHVQHQVNEQMKE